MNAHRDEAGCASGVDGAAPGPGDTEPPKKSTKRVLLILLAIWLGGIVAARGAIYGIHGTRNTSFEPQNEFKLDNWVDPGHLLDQQGRAVPGARRDA